RIEDLRRNGKAGLVTNEGPTEIAGPLERGRDRRHRCLSLIVPQAVIAAEEEQAVAANRSSQSTADVVHSELTLGNVAGVVAERVGIQPLVPHQVRSLAAKRVRARPGAHRDDGLATAVFGAEIVRDDAYFLKALRVGHDGRFVVAAAHDRQTIEL